MTRRMPTLSQVRQGFRTKREEELLHCDISMFPVSAVCEMVYSTSVYKREKYASSKDTVYVFGTVGFTVPSCWQEEYHFMEIFKRRCRLPV